MAASNAATSKYFDEDLSLILDVSVIVRQLSYHLYVVSGTVGSAL